MKKIVYFITAFTMLYGLDSEARLPKSQGLVAADLLLTKADIVGEDKDAFRDFIIDTIYTTKGRNDFAQWMKEAYQECTQISNGSREWKNCTQEQQLYHDTYRTLCELLKGVEVMYPISIIHIFNSGPQQQIIKLANALLPCWTGTFTAFFISANSKKYVDNAEKIKLFTKDKETYTAPTANDVITVSGAPSIWVLSADDDT